MEDVKKFLNPSLFGLILICFLLPFINVSCMGETAHISGLNMVTGGEVMGETIPRNVVAVLTFSAALIGLGFAFMKNRTSNLACSITAGLGFLLTIILKIVVNNQLDEVPVRSEWGAGYYLTMILFMVAAGFNIYMLMQNQPVTRTPIRAASPPHPQQPGKFCPQCGTKNTPSSDFCSQCGARINKPPAANVPPAPSLPPPESYEPPVQPSSHMENIPAPVVDDESDQIPLYERVDHPAVAEVLPLPVKDDDATQLLQPPVIPILIVDHNGQKESVVINKPEFVIGRNREVVDYHEPNNNNIGRTHAQIVSQDGLYYLVDLDSKNGTYINGVKLTSGVLAPLTFGDRITLANSDYIFNKA